MPALKCKMCGGDIQIAANQSYGTCAYCGGTMTLPRADDERRANLFNRANHFRRLNEFDKAMEAYENILNEDNADAEAHWGILLCRYGIEYVEDPSSRKRVPTCRRLQYEPILSDPDYAAALKYAPDAYSRGLYEAEAAVISEIQKGILAISRQEDPFDVFICYKETTDAGTRTKDSVAAQDIYYQLTQAGYRVFFSRITLESKLGTAYEPYIFSALNSARVMVLVGTSAEHFNSVWVKNEWSRFLDLMKKAPNRLLIPCYQGMDPYDMPEKLSFLQAQDMSKIGFIQDLIHGVRKVLAAAGPGAESAAPQTEADGAQSVAAVAEPLLKRAELFLEEGEFAKADAYFDRALDADAECARAYMGKYLVENSLGSEKDVVPFLVASFKKELELLRDATHLKQVVPTTVDVSSATQEAVNSLYGEWSGDEYELDFWMSFDYGYVPLGAAADEAKQKFVMPDHGENGSQNYQYALRFASPAEKEAYAGYLENARAEIDAIAASAGQQDDETMRLCQNKYTRYLSAVIPLLQRLNQCKTKRKRISLSDELGNPSGLGGLIVVTPMLLGFLVSPLFLIGIPAAMVLIFLSSRGDKAAVIAKQEIYPELRAAASIIDNGKAAAHWVVMRAGKA